MPSGPVPPQRIVEDRPNHLPDMLLMRGSNFLTLAVDPRVQREVIIGMLDECLDMAVGLRTPTALLDGGVLADEEPKREIGTPLLDRLDHGESAAGRRMV